MSGMFDEFESDDSFINSDSFVNNTTQSKGHDITDDKTDKAISKTITINKSTVELVDGLQRESRVDFSQMVRAGILALSCMDREEREKLYKNVYVPRNAGRKKKTMY
ncbi:hypothetical protein [Vibrio algicola]|uniref:hypothetical protein n=1 Tax=Vibrio algicola TaxID=2662262 RepID=UPI0015B3AAC5|nr:hypothetical protein [Vibrio algicola]